MQVRYGKLRVADDEMRLTVRRPRGTGKHVVVVARGALFPQTDFDFLVAQLTAVRPTWMSTQPGGTHPHDEPFLAAWTARGFDVATARFSIRHLLGSKQSYPRARLMRQRPGVLQVGWSREEHDSVGDICTTWRVPCSRRDSSFFHYWLSISLPTPDGRAGLDANLHHELRKRGLDVTSLRFEIHHAGRRAALAQEREARAAHASPVPPCA